MTQGLFGQKSGSTFISEGDYISKSFIETNFKGGYEGYSRFFEKNLSFPESSYKDQKEGLLLFHFTINPVKKTIKYEFLTLLDPEIEKQIKTFLPQIVNEWNLNEDKEYQIYQPIIYSMLPYYPEAFEGDIPEIPFDLPLKFLQPFVLIKSNRIPNELTLDLLAEQEVSDAKKSYYKRAETAYNQFMQQEDWQSAYQVLNQIIRYNPLNRDYLLSRIALEKKLNIRKYQAYDATLLGDFVDEANNEYLTLSEEQDAIPTFAERMSQSSARTEQMLISNTQLIEEYYKGGLDGFVYDFSFYIKPPAKRSINGVSFFKISIPPSGDAFIEFLTELDKDVEQNIVKAFEGGKNGWLKRDSTYHQYMACFYTDVPKFTTAFEEQNAAYQAMLYSGSVFRAYLQKPEEIATFNSTGMSASEREEKLDAFFKNKRAKRDSLENAVDYTLLHQYEKEIEQYRSLISARKTKKAFNTLNDLIKVNPFERFLVAERIRLAEEDSKFVEYLEKDRKLLAAINEIYKKAEKNLEIDK